MVVDPGSMERYTFCGLGLRQISHFVPGDSKQFIPIKLIPYTPHLFRLQPVLSFGFLHIHRVALAESRCRNYKGSKNPRGYGISS